MDNNNLSLNSNTISNNQEVFIPGGQSLSSTDGMEWISQAWNLVKRKLGMWILLVIIYFIIISGLQLIPFLGIFAGILSSVLSGGIIALCEKQRTTGEFELGLLFSGFQKNFAPLLGVGALSFGIMLLGIIAMFITGGSAVTNIFLANQYGEIPLEILPSDLSPLLLGVFILFIFSIIAAALTWFAPALIIIHNLKFGAAVSMSLEAVKKNLLPGFLFFIISGLMIVLSVVTLGLGFLVCIPILFASYYSSYRGIFIGKEKSSTLVN
ncbi:BPSS1780 family membrane protein [Photorhabdus luminescens]|uniref:BPSS1780 family membrane protein n=1 Tax=Photorhabdus luminescens TaxID=29488 RepID=UPI0022402B4C|nr:BPSS1780 family membrane protein [Photorhabdus luminescens]MCW7764571.1 BPSS1780 family membrane protein [Photorhabdus luminescens subsp. venezuelensis]